MTTDVALQRSWPLIMRQVGIDPSQVLLRAGLPAGLFGRAEPILPLDQYFHFWRMVESEAGARAFPAEFAERMSIEAFCPMVFAAACSPNLPIAMGRLARFRRLDAPVTLVVENNADGLHIKQCWDGGGSVPESVSMIGLAQLVQFARIGLGRRVRPLKVTSVRPLAAIERYSEFFGVTPETGPSYSVAFGPIDASLPLVTAEPSIWRSFEPDLERRLTALEASTSLIERVRSLVIENLPDGGVTIEEVALKLGVSARTLQRRLRPDGVTFSGLLQQTREETAMSYLVSTQISYAEIARLVGYDEVASFYRAFREWTGMTPAVARAQNEWTRSVLLGRPARSKRSPGRNRLREWPAATREQRVKLEAWTGTACGTSWPWPGAIRTGRPPRG